MNSKHIYSIASMLILVLCVSMFAQALAQDAKESPWEFKAIYKGDIAGGIGGKQSGFGYLGYGSIGVSFNVEKAGWWKGGSITLSGGTTHGVCPSELWLGDVLIADNIEAGNHVFLQELFYSQTLGPVAITAGMHDFNSMYAYSDHAGLFLNSAFGINSVLSTDFSVPIFPLTSWGLNVNWDICRYVSWQAGAYDTPLDFEDNPYNIRWRFTPQKGGIFATEFTFNTFIHDSLEGGIKVGAAYHTAMQNFELHVCGEQHFWKQGDRDMSVFIMAAYAPKSKSENYVNISAGLHFKGVFSAKGHDILGVGVTTAWLNDSYKHETVAELTYRYDINEHIYLQPDFQYILHPASVHQYVNNALYMVLRVGIEF